MANGRLSWQSIAAVVAIGINVAALIWGAAKLSASVEGLTVTAASLEMTIRRIDDRQRVTSGRVARLEGIHETEGREGR